jgi:hypothetical protein
MAQTSLNSTGVASSGALSLQSNGTTEAIGISTAQVATFVKDAVVQGLTVGRGAGSGSTNTAVGASALASNSGDTSCTALGFYALNANTSGSYNVALGRNTLIANTTGSNNIAIGLQALAANTTASDNTAVGHQAAYSNTTGTPINAFGKWALYANTTGANNAAFGFNSLGSNTTGGSNVGLGTYALYSNTTASNNTAVGYRAGYSLTTNGFNTFVGKDAGYACTGNYNTFIGAGLNSGSGDQITSGSKNTILGPYSGNQGGLDIRTASNYIVLSDGDGNPRLYMDNGGYLYSPPTYANTTASAANAGIASNGSFYRSTSALKYKKDIRNLEEMDIGLLRPVRYKSKCEGDDQTKDHLGLIADEAAEAGFEELVTRGATGEVEGFQYERLTVVLLKELQVLKAKVAALENQ